MKKLALAILALAMLLTSAAFAEEEVATMPEEAAAFAGKWVCGRASIEMDWEEEGFRVFIQWGNSASESTEWEYSCFYQEADHSLVSMPTGLRTEVVYDETGAVQSFSEVYNDGEAAFILDEDGCLLWQDAKEDAGKDMRFVRDDPFSGVWVCGRASMEVDLEDGGYKVFISWASSAAEVTEWEYSCIYDAVHNTLEAMPFGLCTDVVYDEKGDIAASSVRYEDGEATFLLEEDGHLLWQDAKEDAGKDMRFEWMGTREAQ